AGRWGTWRRVTVSHLHWFIISAVALIGALSYILLVGDVKRVG
ncbi:hypothetical protein HMPREF9346_02312, partial [Escherichia coli MS 119-7]